MLEDLRYRLWYPPQHGIMMSPETGKRMLAPNIPMRERLTSAATWARMSGRRIECELKALEAAR